MTAAKRKKPRNFHDALCASIDRDRRVQNEQHFVDHLAWLQSAVAGMKSSGATLSDPALLAQYERDIDTMLSADAEKRDDIGLYIRVYMPDDNVRRQHVAANANEIQCRLLQ